LAGVSGLRIRSGRPRWAPAAMVTALFSRSPETVRPGDELAMGAALEKAAPSIGGESLAARWVPDPRGVAAAPSGLGRREVAGLGGVVAIVVGDAAAADGFASGERTRVPQAGSTTEASASHTKQRGAFRSPASLLPQ
jgi:hypothetical protein